MDFTFQENDYKHVMTDFSTAAIGGRLTYREILDHEFAPQKFKNIVRIYILRETSEDLLLAEHLLNLTNKDLAFEIYKQLKVKVHFLYQKGDSYKDKSLKLPEFLQFLDDHVGEVVIVQELVISNLALMGFAV